MSFYAFGPDPTLTAAPPRAPWRGVPDLARPFAIVAAIAVWTLLVNLPTFARQDADDAFFLEVARLWTQGLPPYVAAYDVKGPAGFAFLAAAVALLGPTLSTLKIVAIVASSVAGAALYQIAAPRDRAAAIACVALYPIFMVVCGDVVYQTITATLLVAFALAFGEPVGRSRAAAAGLAIGLACAIKQTCAIDALAVAYVLWAKAGAKGDRLRVLAAFAAATPIIPAGFFLYYVWLGAADVFVADVVVAAWRRGADVSLGAALSSWADCLFPASVVLIVAAAALTRPAEPGERFARRATAVWLAIEAAGLAAQRAGCGTYVTPLIAPALLIATQDVSARFGAGGRGRRTVALAVFGAVAVWAAMVGRGLAMLEKLPRVDDLSLRQIKTAVEATGPRLDDRLLAVNGAAFANIVTDLRPPTPVFHWAHILCDFPGAGLPALAADLRARPRYVVFENPDRRPACQSSAYSDAIRVALATDYVLAAQGGTELLRWKLFERTP
ncbi:MAG: hypothetical protein ABSF67_16650 [Roseiarcus sp.]|jgi:hypothetical protein